MRRAFAVFVAIMSIGLICALSLARAQDETKKDTPKQPANIQPLEPYRLDFSFNEVAEGKNVNTRHYSMDLTAGDSNEIKIGTRVPVATAESPNSPVSQFQYLDVGTNIWAQLREHGDELMLAVRSDVSNLDMGNDPGRTGQPVVRQIKISGTTLLITGKPIVIGSADDPNSKRQFQLEVTATKLR